MRFLLILALLTSSAFAKDILLTPKNTVTLRGPVTSDSIASAMRNLNSLQKEGQESEPIYLVLDTPGGSVGAGLDLMEFSNTLRRPVHAVAIFAASMGFHILQNSPIRYITKYGTIMSHRANGSFEGDIPHQVNSRLKRIIDLIEKMDEHVVSRTKGKHTKKSYADLIHDEYWGIGSNSIKDGFVDEVVTLKCSQELSDATEEKTVQLFVFMTKLKFSKCPLFSSPLNETAATQKAIKEHFTKVRIMEP